MAERVLWVVEMWCEGIPNAGWYPTVGARISRDDARIEVRGWRARNPAGRFRVTPYQPKVK